MEIASSTKAKRHTIYLVGLLLIAASASLVLFDVWLFNSSESLVLSLGNQNGTYRSKPFSVPYDSVYDAVFRADRKFSFKETACLLGDYTPDVRYSLSGPRMDCPAGFYPPAVRWKILANGHLSVSGGTQAGQGAGYSDQSGDRYMGWVHLKRGLSYVAIVDLSQAPPSLWTTTPRFVLTQNDMETGAAMSGIALLAAVIFGLWGAWLTVRGIA
jgi:hypothetical protein